MKYFAQALIVGAATALSLTKETIFPGRFYKGSGEGLVIEYAVDEYGEYLRDEERDKLGRCNVKWVEKKSFTIYDCDGDDVNVTIP